MAMPSASASRAPWGAVSCSSGPTVNLPASAVTKTSRSVVTFTWAPTLMSPFSLRMCTVPRFADTPREIRDAFAPTVTSPPARRLT
jgi:hypothetical protein